VHQAAALIGDKKTAAAIQKMAAKLVGKEAQQFLRTKAGKIGEKRLSNNEAEMTDCGSISARLYRQLQGITPSRDGDVEYFPRIVALSDGRRFARY